VKYDANDEQFWIKATHDVRDLNTSKGWHDGNTRFAEYVALLHSEVSEMLEEWRDANTAELALEFADVLIRLIDMADVYGINIFLAYQHKMEKNWKRPYQHGGRTLHHEKSEGT